MRQWIGCLDVNWLLQRDWLNMFANRVTFIIDGLIRFLSYRWLIIIYRHISVRFFFQCNDANVMSFLYQHFSFPCKILNISFVQLNCSILDYGKKCFWCDCVDCFVLSVNKFIIMMSSINPLDIKHRGLLSHMSSCLIGKI